MELVYVDKLPDIAREDDRSPRHDLLKFVNEFLESGRNIALVRLDPGDFHQNHNCASGLHNAIKYHKIAGVKVKVRNNKTYLVRLKHISEGDRDG